MKNTSLGILLCLFFLGAQLSLGQEAIDTFTPDLLQSAEEFQEWYSLAFNEQKNADKKTLHNQNQVVNHINDKIVNIKDNIEFLNGQLPSPGSDALFQYQKNYYEWKEVFTRLTGDTSKLSSTDIIQLRKQQLYSFYYTLESATKVARLAGKSKKPVKEKLDPKSASKPHKLAMAQAILSVIAYPIKRQFYPASLISSLNSVLGHFKRNQGIQIEVDGQMPSESDENVVTFYLPNHRDAMTDEIIFFNLGIPDGILFANCHVFSGMLLSPLKRVLPETAFQKAHARLSYIFATSKDVVSVGRERNRGSNGEEISPTGKLLMAFGSGVSRNVLSYPQGFVVHNNEHLPINPSFVKKLIKPVMEAGYKVRIVPITFEVDEYFMNFRKSYVKGPLYAHIHEAIEPEQMERIIELELSEENPELLSTILRSIWKAQSTHYPELTAEQMIKKVDQIF